MGHETNPGSVPQNAPHREDDSRVPSLQPTRKSYGGCVLLLMHKGRFLSQVTSVPNELRLSQEFTQSCPLLCQQIYKPWYHTDIQKIRTIYVLPLV